jgi:hypothetical protein
MSNSVEELVAEYRHSAIEHGAATAVGDHRKTNRHHDRLMAAVRGLREQGGTGTGALLPLLDDEDRSVRCWAATHCLRIDEDRARGTLEQLAAQPGIFAFNAQVVLSEWEKGTLDIP